jgi:acyl-CoA reductase-like NAD-dependent aldehyde dehydrogenase
MTELLKDYSSSVPDSTPEEVKEAVESARVAGQHWAAFSCQDRAKLLHELRPALVAHMDELVDVVVADTGKVPTEALANEILVSAELIAYYERHAPRTLAPKRVGPGLLAHKSGQIRYEPRGVIGVISPWNYPLVLSVSPVVTALFAGNAVVLKPSEVTPHVGLVVGQLIERVLREAGAPGDLVKVVSGPGSVGDALVRSGVDMVAFTGSVRTGKAVMKAASESLTPVLLELGGKDPMIVCADAQIERAANAAVWGAFTNAGQTCLSVERVYVVNEVYDSFVEKVVSLTQRLRQGSHLGADLGAVTWQRQYEIVRRHLDDAIAKGAVVAAGGSEVEIDGRISLQPTVLLNVDHSMDVMREETFGPILPVMAVSDPEEALKLANDSPYGLGASLWARDPKLIDRLVSGVRAGNIAVNDVMIFYAMPALPFGGIGQSGMNRTHGIQGLREMCNVKSVAQDRLGLKREPNWMPLPGWLDGGVRKLLQIRHGASLSLPGRNWLRIRP